MNAANPVPSPASAVGDSRPYEPSMEEILASIRRIIADDQSLPGRIRTEKVAPAEAEPASIHVLRSEDKSSDKLPEPTTTAKVAPDLGEIEQALGMAPQGPIAPQYPSPEIPKAPALEPEAVTVSSDRIDDAVREDVQESSPKQQEPPAKQEMPAATSSSVDYFDPPEERERFEVPAKGPAPLSSSSTNNSVASAFNVLAASRLADNSDDLLGMAREMIRPLLRSWLDDNLPSMVERLVRDEIERVARGGR